MGSFVSDGMGGVAWDENATYDNTDWNTINQPASDKQPASDAGGHSGITGVQAVTAGLGALNAILGAINGERARALASTDAAAQRASNERIAGLQAEVNRHIADLTAAGHPPTITTTVTGHQVATDPNPPPPASDGTILGMPPAVAIGGAVVVGGVLLWLVADTLMGDGDTGSTPRRTTPRAPSRRKSSRRR